MIQATRPEAAPGGRVQRAGLALWSGSAGIVLLILLAVLPVPYVVEAPGPTVDALGRADGVELIQAPDAPSHPVTGQLRLTTVTTDGANRDLALGAALAGWLAADSAVIPYESVYPRAVTKRERQERAALQMSSSQEAATVAALQELGEPVGLTIASAVTDAAKAVFREGDSLLAVDGREVDGYRQLIGALEAIPPGTAVRIEIGRAGARSEVELVTGDDGAGHSRLGVTVRFEPSRDVRFGVEGIGGASAGLVFALGIVDKLGPTDLTGGHVVAGTGTIDPSGQVGPIGGIEQKLIGARRDGAEYFLAPAANCAEAAGHVPDGLTVIRVETLADALEGLAAVREGSAGGLPGCS